MWTWRCEYTKTYSGTCEQQKELGEEHCYYHNRVLRGFITDVDERAVIREMPTIAME